MTAWYPEMLLNDTIREEDEPEKNFLFLGLAIVPIAAIVGNCLVVAAVWTTRSLQTSTNYLLVSLAVADLVVSAFVMPFSIYLSVLYPLRLFYCSSRSLIRRHYACVDRGYPLSTSFHLKAHSQL